MSYIKPEIIEKINDQSDLVSIISDFVELKKSGANYVGLSPFVDEKTPSFIVSPAKGVWKDFSSGKGGNNPVSFLMEIENIPYPEAIEWLAKKFAIPIEYENIKTSQEIIQKQEKMKELHPLLELVIKKYEEEFHKLPDDHPAKIEVYQKRKYTEKIVREWRIGYAPGKKFIYDLCVNAGRKQDALDLGLINEDCDKWQNRVIYPLLDRKTNIIFPVGLAGRNLNDGSKYAKWMNSSESDLYSKNSFWYGLAKSKEAIVKKGEVWLVEGYNDVIAWQENGISNTVASCGTAISEKQIKILKKLCDKVIFCFDPDEAGKKSMLKHIPEFLKNGFRVQTVLLVPEVDPDDYVRFCSSSAAQHGLEELGTNIDFRDDGFKFLMLERFKDKDPVDIAKETKVLAGIVANIEDDAMREIYTDWLSKESGVKLPQVRGFIKSSDLRNKERKAQKVTSSLYVLPPEVKTQLDQLLPVIEKYQLFIANNRIWIQEKGDPPYKFRSVSNFRIDIIQHMQDEKFPMKLIRIRNVHGLERIFDMQSSDMNSPITFENAVTAHGNFRWKGSRSDHELLKTYLFDNMGTGRKIEVLGWQPEGFWVWNNKVITPGKPCIPIDSNGVFEKDDISYYVPSANEIYRRNIYKYQAQKKVVSLEPHVSFEKFTTQVLKVHREHGLVGILFSIASIFQDVVVEELNMFPILFLYGPASSGKDQLAGVCQSFFGLPQTAINLEGGVSTVKAQVREFAQFSNTISHLSEYKNGDAKLDGILKALWDRRGYKRGNIDSHVGTESIPILSSVLLTGNYSPDDEPLNSRLIWEIMDKTCFSSEEVTEYEKLSDLTKNGISSFTDEFLNHRGLVEKNFKHVFRGFQSLLKERKPEAISRMISNLAVLGTFYQLFKDIIHFSFSTEEMIEHFETIIDKQMNRMANDSIISKWWNCFLESIRTSASDRLCVGRDFKLSDEHLYFNFTNCYNRVARQWFIQYKNNMPAKGLMIDSLKKDKAWVKSVPGTRMAKGKNSKSTSAYVANINDIPVNDEIKSAIDLQIDTGNIYFNSTNSGSIAENNNENENDDLPF